MEKAEERIQERLKNYLKRDSIGIRKAVLKLFLSDGAYTTEDVYTYLGEGRLRRQLPRSLGHGGAHEHPPGNPEHRCLRRS